MSNDNIKDVVAVPAPEIQVNDQIQAMCGVASEEIAARATKLYDDVVAAGGETPATVHLALSALSQMAAVVAVTAIGKAMATMGYGYQEAFRVLNVDIQQREQAIIQQLSVPVAPGNGTVN